jgi:hypothetical protein
MNVILPADTLAATTIDADGDLSGANLTGRHQQIISWISMAFLMQPSTLVRNICLMLIDAVSTDAQALINP